MDNLALNDDDFSDLGALADKEQHKKLTSLPLDVLVFNKHQIRSTMDTQESKEHIDSIKNAILAGEKPANPIKVTPVRDEHGDIVYPERYMIIAGHHRTQGAWDAKKEALEYNSNPNNKNKKQFLEMLEVEILLDISQEEIDFLEFTDNKNLPTHILDEARRIMMLADKYGKDHAIAKTGISAKKFSEYKNLEKDFEPELRDLLIKKNIRTPRSIMLIKKLEGEEKDRIRFEIKNDTFSAEMLKNGAPKRRKVEQVNEDTGDVILVHEIVEEEPKPKKVNSIPVNRKVMAHILKELKGQTIEPDSDEIIAQFKQFVEDVKKMEFGDNESR